MPCANCGHFSGYHVRDWLAWWNGPGSSYGACKRDGCPCGEYKNPSQTVQAPE